MILSPEVMAAAPSVCSSLCQPFCGQYTGSSFRDEDLLVVPSSAPFMAQLTLSMAAPYSACLPHNLIVFSVSDEESTQVNKYVLSHGVLSEFLLVISSCLAYLAFSP